MFLSLFFVYSYFREKKYLMLSSLCLFWEDPPPTITREEIHKFARKERKSSVRRHVRKSVFSNSNIRKKVFHHG